MASYKGSLHVRENSTNLDIKIYGCFFIDVGNGEMLHQQTWRILNSLVVISKHKL